MFFSLSIKYVKLLLQFLKKMCVLKLKRKPEDKTRFDPLSHGRFCSDDDNQPLQTGKAMFDATKMGRSQAPF